jgi:polysaccharide biosynthesis/export protein
LRKAFYLGVLLLPTVLVAPGCTFLPRNGPDSIDITAPVASSIPYALVKVSPGVVAVLEHAEPRGLAGTFHDLRTPSQILFGVGDVVGVSVFEAAAGGLYIPAEAGIRPGNFVTLPEQIVDNNGNITVPYAGVVKATGRTNVQIQDEILERIKNRAIDPQVVVTPVQQRSSLVSVLGEVNLPVRYPAAYSGAQDRVTDALTRAGGIRGQGYETWVMLERGRQRATVPFENLVMHPANNIYVQPGDRIYVYREQQKFMAFGATGLPQAGGQQGEFNFDAWRISLAEAVAKAGGLLDLQADPGSVFLYRREPRDVALHLGVDCARFEGETIPIIYSISFQDPGGYFLATKIQMRNQDVIFAANAPSVEISKFLFFINNVVGTGSNIALGIQYGVGAKNALTIPPTTSTTVVASPTPVVTAPAH